MTAGTSPQALLLRGCATLIGETGKAVYHDDGTAYTPGTAQVVFETLPPDAPAVALAIYDEQPVDWSSTRYFMQARIRTSADPLDLDLVDAVRDALAWRRHPQWPFAIRVTQIVPVSFARLGLIAGGYEYTRNFSMYAARSAAWDD